MFFYEIKLFVNYTSISVRLYLTHCVYVCLRVSVRASSNHSYNQLVLHSSKSPIHE